MKNKKLEAFIFIITGLIIVACGLYIYFVSHTIYHDTDSSRGRDLNWLLKTFGRTGTTLLIGAIGFIPLYLGLRKLTR
jgi:cytochrome c biogenesis factor